MASFIKKHIKKQEATEQEVSEPLHSPENKDACFCGEPVAKELGQNQVCKKHIRTN